MKLRRISYSHNPTISQINTLSVNLHKNFPNNSFNVEVSCWNYEHDHSNSVNVQISTLPAFNNIDSCSVKHFNSWKELLSWYLKVMKEDFLSE